MSIRRSPKAINKPTYLLFKVYFQVYWDIKKLIFRKSMENHKMFAEVSEKWVRIKGVLKPHKTQDPMLRVVF